MFDVPDAAAPIDMTVDVGRRTIGASMMLRAPSDKKSTKARLNWLLRQIQRSPDTDLHIRLHWPGRRPHSQYELSEIRNHPDIATDANPGNAPNSLEVCMIRRLGGRFGQRKNFITDIEQLAPTFYETIGQHLRAYQAPAPRVREDRTDPESVTPEGLRQSVEAWKQDDVE